MKLDVASNVLASSGLQQTSQFKIATSAHAFRILSSGLYSDKLGAVLREVGCNAADAHIAAGIPDEPFEVHLPTRLVNKFYIQDFGPGLSEDDIVNLYSTYFSSSKSNDNTQTGGFGLGSKSPFAYTDRFTVVSRHGGARNTYAAYVGTDGAPTISKVDSAPMEVGERTGLTVSMPINPRDMYELQTKVQSIFQYFRVPPRVLNGDAIKPIEFTQRNAEWGILKEGFRRSDTFCSVVMGNVCYPVRVAGYADDVVDWVHQVRPVLFADIGTLDVAASREQLEMTPRTKKELARKLDVVVREATKEVVDVINGLDFKTVAGIRAAKETLVAHGITSWWAVLRNRGLVATGVLDDCIRAYRGAFWQVPQAYVGKKARIIYKTASNAIRDHYEVFDLRSMLNIFSTAVLTRDKATYLRERVRASTDYTHFILFEDTAVDPATFAKDCYDIPLVDPRTLPMPTGWVPPSQRPKRPKQPKKEFLAPTFSLDSANRVRQTEEPVLTWTNYPNYYVERYTAWGEKKYTSKGYRLAPADVLDVINPLRTHLPWLPEKIVALSNGEREKYASDPLKWKPLVALVDRLTDHSVLDRVNTTEGVEMPFDFGGYFHYAKSPLHELAGHAKANTLFWQMLVKLVPKSNLIKAATHAAQTGSFAPTNPQKVIPVEQYNSLLRALGARQSQVVTQPYVDGSQQSHPSFNELRSMQLGNKNKLPIHLAAQMAAAAILFDETGIMPIDYSQLAA